MKSIERIKKEYENYKPRTDFLHSVGDLTAFLEVGIDDLEESIEELKQQIQDNKGQKIEAAIRNFLFIIFGEEDLDFYDEDSKIVEEQIALSIQFIQYFETIQSLAMEGDLSEWIRLSDFITDHYNQNFDYLEAERDSLELSLKGISSFNPKYEDSRESFSTFFEEETTRLSPKKTVEKMKKMC